MASVRTTSIYAVGLNGLIIRWDGARWTKIPNRLIQELRAVRVAPDGTVWAVGDQGAIASVRNGVATVESFPVVDDLTGVSVDQDGTAWVSTVHAIFKRTNATWVKSLETTSGSFTDLMVVDKNQILAIDGNNELILRMNGTSWTQQAAPFEGVYGIFGRYGGASWLAGGNGNIIKSR